MLNPTVSKICQEEASKRVLAGNKHWTSGTKEVRQPKSEQAKRKQKRNSESHSRSVNVGDRARAKVALKVVKSKFDEAQKASISNDDKIRLTGLFQNETTKASSVRMQAKIEKVSSKLGKFRKPNAVQRLTGVDLPLEAAGLMTYSTLKKNIYIPCIKEELDKRGVAHDEGKKVGELVDLLQENEGDEKIFRPKMNIWQAMALLDD